MGGIEPETSRSEVSWVSTETKIEQLGQIMKQIQTLPVC
jgi:hypothetical protein